MFRIPCHICRVFFIAGASLALAAIFAVPAHADRDGGLPALEAQVAALQAQVQALQKNQTNDRAAMTALQNTVASQAATITALTAKTAPLSVQDGVGTGTELYFTGVNVHIITGLGATNGDPANPFDFRGDSGPIVTNGLGNLIIGYNVLGRPFGHPVDVRTGSHNLILGDGNNYSSYGGIIGGQLNTISGTYASVIDGSSNKASLDFALVTGGVNNTASGAVSVVTGGSTNASSGEGTVITGGNLGTASGFGSVLIGGDSNTSSGFDSVELGGNGNTASGDDSIAP
ncbi:MAG TPA: hypothetical protein VFW40_03320 [Capsulimonadaceae bacterium]|nr:hypothetical protein [Capsulimonadaceae bacterium]